MGFLKFLGAIAMIIIGLLGVVSSFLGCISNGISSSITGRGSSDAVFWIIGIISFVIFLGGIYVLRRKV
jgi:hypothetical protein